MNDDSDATIPFRRIIHRMWKTDTVPDAWAEGEETCRRANLDWIYCHWTDAELSSFVAAVFPDFLPTYNSYPYNIQRADAARYLLLYHYAGIYLDLDIKCRLSFDDILTDVAKFSRPPSDVNDVILAEAEPFGVVSDFLAVRRPRDPFMRHVTSGLCPSALVWYPLPYMTVMFSTGPVYLSRRVRDVTQKVAPTVVPTRLYTSVYFAHLDGGSWHSWDGRLIWTAYLRRYQLARYCRNIIILTLCCAFVIIIRTRLCHKRHRLHDGGWFIKPC